MDGMKACGEMCRKLEEELRGLGEQIAFKRADLPALLGQQEKLRHKLHSIDRTKRAEARRKEAMDLLCKRSFIKAQMALSDCLKLVAEIDSEEVDLSELQESISETKKVAT